MLFLANTVITASHIVGRRGPHPHPHHSTAQPASDAARPVAHALQTLAGSALAHRARSLRRGPHAASSGRPASQALACNPGSTFNQGLSKRAEGNDAEHLHPHPGVALPVTLMPKSYWITGNAISPIHPDASVSSLYRFWFDLDWNDSFRFFPSNSVWVWVNKTLSLCVWDVVKTGH